MHGNPRDEAYPALARDAALPALTLALGGARSGKSRFAESLVLASGLRPVYVATAGAGDAEMAARIAAHRARRGSAWTTVEEPLDIAGAASGVAEGSAVLVDCLTLWLANLMAAGRDPDAECAALLAALGAARAPVVCVANEVGLGIVPDNPLARRFRDAAGAANRRIAAAADRVWFVVAGLPQRLK